MRTKEKEVKTFVPKQIAQICDHTFLKGAEVYKRSAGIGESPVRLRQKDFFQFLEEACNRTLVPYAICVRPEDVPHAKAFLEERKKNNICIVAAVGFPEGHWYKSNYKLFETQFALNEGAGEIDLVMNYQALKEGDHGAILGEVQAITKAVHQQKKRIKLILETSELNSFQIVQACNIASHCRVDFVKTSTGFGAYGVQTESLELICKNFHGGIKISGGIHIDNIQLFLSVIQKVRGSAFQLKPEFVRIGESELLKQLEKN